MSSALASFEERILSALFAGTGSKPPEKTKPPEYIGPEQEFASGVASALASSIPSSLIEIVVGYAESPVVAMGYRCDRLVVGSKVDDIQATERAFAVRMGDGSVTCWGDPRFGGDCSKVRAKLKKVKAICGTARAFAAIVGDDNTVICWGDKSYGGDCSAVASELTQVQGICGSSSVFAALKQDGSVVTWGGRGGEDSTVQTWLKGVKAIYSVHSAFAAVLDDGEVRAWGSRREGGLIPASVQERLKHVQCICGTRSAFAALLSDGTVETWGYFESPPDNFPERDVKSICATESAFAALKKDGKVITWGDKEYSLEKERGCLIKPGNKAVLLGSAGCLFTAVMSDGIVVTWGPGDRGAMSTDCMKDVEAIRGAYSAFAALQRDGTVTTWGEKQESQRQGSVTYWGEKPENEQISTLYSFGADHPEVQSELKQVVAIASAGSHASVFAALRSDGKVVTWAMKPGNDDKFYVVPASLKPSKLA